METKKKYPRSKRGTVINFSEPKWEPILHLARIYVDELMWMCEVELKGGTCLQVYKHHWTRQYLHLDSEGNAFAYRGDDLYRQVPEDELCDLFDRVVGRPHPSIPSRERREMDEDWQTIEGSTEPDALPDVPF
jgi:hypothetical protein